MKFCQKKAPKALENKFFFNIFCVTSNYHKTPQQKKIKPREREIDHQKSLFSYWKISVFWGTKFFPLVSIFAILYLELKYPGFNLRNNKNWENLGF